MGVPLDRPFGLQFGGRNKQDGTTNRNRHFPITDIEGSTRLWEEQLEAMQIALARHDEILLAAVKQHGGFQVNTISSNSSISKLTHSNPWYSQNTIALAGQIGYEWNRRQLLLGSCQWVGWKPAVPGMDLEWITGSVEGSEVASDLKVFITRGEASCEECGEDLGRHAWIFLVRDKGALCLACADLDHLVYLPAGDAALTRRSRKHSTLVAVVLEWSRTRKRYERQGLLVEDEALTRAEQECLADADARARRREREAARRAIMDKEYVTRFAGRVRKLYPGCPAGQEVIIAEYACLKYSGRVGRSAAAKEMDAEAVRLAVTAHIRHAETDYDELLAKGWERWEARDQVSSAVEQILVQWQENG